MKLRAGTFLFGFLVVGPISSCASTRPEPCAPMPLDDASEPFLDAGEQLLDAGELEASDGDVGATSSARCATACARLRSPSVGCRTGRSVDGGDSCEATCRRVVDSRLTPLDVACAARAASLAAAKKCRGWGC